MTAYKVDSLDVARQPGSSYTGSASVRAYSAKTLYLATKGSQLPRWAVASSVFRCGLNRPVGLQALGTREEGVRCPLPYGHQALNSHEAPD